jgi:hypothetical protein
MHHDGDPSDIADRKGQLTELGGADAVFEPTWGVWSTHGRIMTRDRIVTSRWMWGDSTGGPVGEHAHGVGRAVCTTGFGRR